MALCSFTDNYSIFDITPVDNMFIEDYMLRAPGDFVKVYLYGLRLCYARDDKTDLIQMAGILGIEPDVVQNAMLFWERHGMVRRLFDNPPSYQFISMRERMLRDRDEDSSIYTMGQFNNEVLRLLGTEGRIIHADDYSRMFQWMEDYSLSETAVLKVIEYLCKQNKLKGKKAPTVTTVEKFVIKMANQKIVSDEAVFHYLHGLTDDVVQLKKLLAHMGIRKDSPSSAEEMLYVKWREWGFDYEALELLSDEMTKIQKPTMGYLDRIVESYQQMGVRDIHQIREYQTATLEPAREVLAALGTSMSFSTQLVRAYTQKLAEGFEHLLLVEAAKISARSGNASLSYWQSILDRYAANGIMTMEAFEREKQHNMALRSFTQQIFALCGDTSVVNGKEIRQVEAWLNRGRSEALILAAAKCCPDTPYKLSAIGKILTRLEQAGISQPDAVESFLRQAQEKSIVSPQVEKRVSKNVSAQNYTQRQYDAAQYNDMVVFDLGQYEGEHDDIETAND